MTVCHFSAVTAGYRENTPVLSDLSFRIDSGLTLIRGANGTGKSTVVELISGALRPFSGTVSVHGLPAHEPRLRTRRAVCRSSPALYPALTVGEHIELLRPVKKVSEDELRARISAYGLRAWWDTPTGELSTGNLRKAWVVLTTIEPPEFLVFDEPFNGMDTEGMSALLDELGHWSTEGRSVAVVAHHPPPELEEFSTHTVRLTHLDGSGDHMCPPTTTATDMT
ncbi:ATP-binding cassette domain-containing protein [Streptomyces sioyaensis]|uniref:ABC transporter ATP-binding protein n=1 Tax=Streptomyces sioyaensis TaxID=67364 RepID=UPI0037D459F0